MPMKNNLIIAWICILSLHACSQNEPPQVASTQQQGPKKEIGIKTVEKLASLFANIKQTRNDTGTDSFTITPVPIGPSDNEPVQNPELYIVNYTNNEGYLIISANENNFPIVSFNDQGNFLFNQEDSISKAAIRELYEAYLQECDGETVNVWSDIMDCLNNPELTDDNIPVNSSDSVCVTSIAFFTADTIDTDPDETEATEIQDDETSIIKDFPDSLLGTRSIPDRKKPAYRAPVFPLVGNSLRWHGGRPYNIDLPRISYSIPMIYGDQAPVPYLTLALSKIMHYHKTPRNINWTQLPQKVTQYESSDVSRLFRDISTTLGAKVNNRKTYDISGSQICNLPNILENTYRYLSGGRWMQYTNDINSFSQVYNSLRSRNPVLFCIGNIRSGNIGDAWIVDGYQEMYVKVVKKWYFCAICYKKRTYYYYRDYFHHISSRVIYRNSKNDYYDYYDGWYRYDHKTNTKNAYAIIDIQAN